MPYSIALAYLKKMSRDCLHLAPLRMARQIERVSAKLAAQRGLRHVVERKLDGKKSIRRKPKEELLQLCQQE